jgi:hypothetical protein
MGFSGGSANVTKAHQHDGAVVQDGGSLAANATQFGLTNGSLLYSDGTNIQELGVGASGYVLGTAAGTVPTWEASAASIVMSVQGQMVYFDGSRTALNIGSESDVLTVSAGGLPVWSAPAAPAWEVVFSDTRTTDSNDWENTFTAIPQDDYAMFCLQVQAGFSNDASVLAQFHDGGGAITTGYYSDGVNIFNGTATYMNENNLAYATIAVTNNNRKSVISTTFIVMGNSNFTDSQNERFTWWGAGGSNATNSSTQAGMCSENPITSFDGITLYANAVAGPAEFMTGSTATMWKIAKS